MVKPAVGMFIKYNGQAWEVFKINALAAHIRRKKSKDITRTNWKTGEEKTYTVTTEVYDWISPNSSVDVAQDAPECPTND